MSSCSVKWCGRNSRTSSFKKDGITFHRFPKCPERKANWIDATFRGEGWFPRNISVVCSRHFTKDNFYAMKGRRRLTDTAVPTLYLPVLSVTVPGRLGCSTSAADDSRGSGGEGASWQHADNPPDDAELNSDDDLSDDSTLYEQTARAQPKLSAKRPRAPTNVKVTEQLHEGIRCSECSGDIAGFRYTCVQCADYDLCAACEASGAHALHYVLRVPEPRPYIEIQAVVERIRRELMSGMHAVVPAGASGDDHADSFKVEVKLEVEDAGPDPLLDIEEPVLGEQRPPRNILERALAGIKVEVPDIEYEPDTDATEVLTHTTHREENKTPAGAQAQHSYVAAAQPPKRQFIEIDLGTMSVVGSQESPTVPQKTPTVSQKRPKERPNVAQKRPSAPQKSPATKKKAVAGGKDAGPFGFQVFTHSSGSKAGSASDAAAEPGTSASFVHKQQAPGEKEKTASNNK